MSGRVDWRWLEAFPCEQGVYLIDPPTDFEQVYAAVRASEGRLLNDDAVARLPEGARLTQAAEWRVRALGCARLIDALREAGRPLRILEVGCGNGWLSARLHRAGHELLGIDPFTAELLQAARVFAAGPRFARADAFSASLPPDTFDAVVFAASLPYFPDARAVLQRALELLAPGGRVHVLDSMLYARASRAAEARERSARYYAHLGQPAMVAHYHAHLLPDVLDLPGARVLHAPDRWPRINRLLGRAYSPFTHLVLTRTE